MSAGPMNREGATSRLRALRKAVQKVPTFADTLSQMRGSGAKLPGMKAPKAGTNVAVGTQPTLVPTVDADPEKARIKGAIERMGGAPKKAEKPAGKTEGKMSGMPTAPTLQKSYQPHPDDIAKWHMLDTAMNQLGRYHKTMDPKHKDHGDMGTMLNFAEGHMERARGVMESSGPSAMDRVHQTLFTYRHRSVEASHLDEAHNWLDLMHQHVKQHTRYDDPATRPQITLPPYERKSLKQGIKDRYGFGKPGPTP